MLTSEEIENRVGFHKATVEGANATLPKHAHLRRLFKQVMTELNQVLPDGRAKSVAMIQLEDSSMWSHKAVAELAPLVSEGSQDTAQLELDVEQACEIMHDAYEEAAVKAGWSTQEASQKPWIDVPEANKETMRAAVSALLKHVNTK